MDAGAGDYIGLFFGVGFFSPACSRMKGNGGSHVKRENGVTALGPPVLDDIFPFFLVLIFLRLGPRIARGENQCV